MGAIPDSTYPLLSTPPDVGATLGCARLASDMSGLRREVHELRVGVRELPGAIIEMLDERDRHNG
jgi:hypothetical protein